MKNLKSIKIAILMLLFVYIFVAFCGCIFSNKNDLSDKQQFFDQIKQDYNNDDSIDCTAAPFAQEKVLSAVFPLYINIVEDNIYVGDALYEKIECISNPDMIFNDFTSANKEITDEECFEIIEKIKNSESCYMLETESVETVSKKIAVYRIDDNYYFLSFLPNSENQVARIHYVNVK